MAAEMWTYDRLHPGATIGRHVTVLDEALFALWHRLFPDDDLRPLASPGLLTVVTMRAFMHVLKPHPDGNVHAGQRLEIARLPRAGERLTTTVTCTGKEVRKGRRCVRLRSKTRDAAGALVLAGDNTSLWAA